MCNKDDTIIVSTSQATLIGQINAFLSIKPAQFEPTELRRGILLCMLCILFWCLYLCNEFRAIGLSCEAILQVPTGARTRFEQGRFVSISRARRCVYLLARLIRGMIAGLLLYGGIVWLANTTSIKELMLNLSSRMSTLFTFWDTIPCRTESVHFLGGGGLMYSATNPKP